MRNNTFSETWPRRPLSYPRDQWFCPSLSHPDASSPSTSPCGQRRIHASNCADQHSYPYICDGHCANESITYIEDTSIIYQILYLIGYEYIVLLPMIAHPLVYAVLECNRIEDHQHDSHRQFGFVCRMGPQSVWANGDSEGATPSVRVS